MALTDENTGMVMPVAPMYSNNGGNGFGNFGGDGWWIILLLLACNGGWGFGGGFGGGYGMMMNGMLGYDFPWLMTGQQNINSNTNNGFRDAMLNDGITSIRDGISGLSTQMCGGFGDIQNTLCNGFNGVNVAINGAQNALAQQMYSNQIADLERSYAAQTASTQGMNALQAQLAQASADNRLGVANLGSDIAREACATRTSDTQNTQVILNAINAGFRAMSDQRYQDKIDAKNDEIAQLRQENLYARGQASQAEQTAIFQQGLINEVDALYNRFKNCPVGTTPVYGNQPIFTCAQNIAGTNGCGCGSF